MEIIEKFLDVHGKVSSQKLKKITKDEIEKICNLTKFLDEIPHVKVSFRLRCLINRIYQFPICPVCLMKNTRISPHNSETFKKTCSTSCANKDPDRILKIKANTDYKAKTEKMAKTNMERYGVPYYTQTSMLKDHNKQNCLDKFGVEYLSQSPIILSKIKKTRANNKSRYKENYELKKNDYYITRGWWWKYDKNRLEKELKEVGGSVVTLAARYGISFTTLYNAADYHKIKIKKDYVSYGEREIAEFLTQHNINFVQNTRKIISPQELDFYLPDHNLAIEFDGLFWHSEEAGKDKHYHLNKTKDCEKQGIQLIHIFENEWINNSEIVKSRVLSKIGKSENKIYARKCSISEIPYSNASDFLKENHIQGLAHAKINFGLFYNNELVAVMNFCKSRFNRKYEYELLRFCNKKNTNVVGGASKLFSYFIKLYNPQSVISYSDKRWNTGKLYEKIGFFHSHDSSPNYWYFKDCKLESRIKFQKHKLEKLWENFDPTLTEYENMSMNDYLKIWDCGNSVWVWQKH